MLSLINNPEIIFLDEPTAGLDVEGRVALIAPIAFEAKTPANLMVYFSSLILLIIVSLAVGTVLGLIIKTTSKLTMVSQFIFLPSLMLSGIMFPTNLLPKTLENLGIIFPATWGLRIMKSDVLDVKLLMPLLIIFIIAALVSAYRLSKIGLE